MTENKSIQNQLFNKERIFNYVKTFSFPRLAGTEGEKKAVDLTIKTFKDIGFKDTQIESEPFEFSDFYSTTLIKLIMTVNLTFNLMLLFLYYIYPIVSILLIISMVIFVIIIVRAIRKPEKDKFWAKYFGNILQATNVIVKIPAKSLPENEAANIVISAHLDSKSQTFKTAWRIISYRVWLYSSIILGILYLTFLVFIIGNLPIEIIIIWISDTLTLNDLAIWTFLMLISLSNVILLFLNTENKSIGALDNATGMSIVFELSSYFKDHPLDNYNLWFCQFSAEELGTMGSREFAKNRDNQFIKGKVFQINLDMLSSVPHAPKKNRLEYLKSYGVLPRKNYAPLLSKYMEKAAKIEKIRLVGFHLSTGAHLDSVPFHLRGFDAIDLTTRWGALFAHSTDDTLDKVDPKVLMDCCILVRRAVLMLEGDYKTLCENQEIICEEE